MNWDRFKPAFVVLFGFVLGTFLSPWLSGCSAEFGLEEEAKLEVSRFIEVYDEYSPNSPTRESDLNLFYQGFRQARDQYVHPVNDVEMIDAAIKGIGKLEGEVGSFKGVEVAEAALNEMLHSLDPRSSYMNPEAYSSMRISTRGEFGGMGIEVSLDEGVIRVISPIEDTPADRAGIQAGDLITHLDGRSIKGEKMTLMQAVQIMRGKKGTPITVTIERAGVDPFDVTVVRDIVQVRAVRWRTEGDYGYIRVVRFSEKVEEGIEKAFEELNAQLGDRTRGYILDLRNNPGGLLSQSVELADAFLEDGTVVSIKGRYEEGDRVYGASSGDLANGLPVIVLINRGSASASEIVAGALQDYKRALVLGERSFGKGSVQSILDLDNGGALRLTTALYYLPNGRAVQAVGIRPDILVKTKKPEEDTFKREGEVEGALPAEQQVDNRRQVEIAEEKCPEIGERKDRLLGCALEVLKAGSAEKFLAIR